MMILQESLFIWMKNDSVLVLKVEIFFLPSIFLTVSNLKSLNHSILKFLNPKYLLLQFKIFLSKFKQLI